MKRKIILILAFLFMLSSYVYAESLTISANIYYFENLEDFGYKLSNEEFESMDSSEKRKIALKIQADLYSKNIKSDYNMEMDLGKENNFNFGKSGYYLFIFDKKKVDSKIISSNPTLIYSSGEGRIFVKEESTEIEVKPDTGKDHGQRPGSDNIPSIDQGTDNKISIDIVFDSGEFDFLGTVKVAVYDSNGNLLIVVELTTENDYRYTLYNLDSMENYAVLPLNLDDYEYTVDRIGNTFYIKLVGQILNEDGQNGQDNQKESISGEKTDKNIAGNAESNISSQKEKLPQTGVLWLPIPFLFALGIIFIVLGKRKDD